MAAAAWTDGRLVPARVAVSASGSGYKVTLAWRWACWRRCSAPSGSTANTARRRKTRSWPVVCWAARDRTRDSMARAVSSSRGAMASAMRRAQLAGHHGGELAGRGTVSGGGFLDRGGLVVGRAGLLDAEGFEQLGHIELAGPGQHRTRVGTGTHQSWHLGHLLRVATAVNHLLRSQ
jgi:hypothetical protein